MSAHVLTMSDESHEGLQGSLLVSLILHLVLFSSILLYTLIGFHLGTHGPSWGTEGATRVGAVASLPGIPLPSPMLTTHTQVATQNTGLYKTEPVPKEETPPDAQQIPKFKDAVRPEKLERVNTRIHKTKEIPPPNAIPYGESGPPTMSYSQMVTTAGTGGIAVGAENSFGQQYAWYVASMRARISANWLLATISPNITSAPRVYLSFQISRDGTITNVQVTQPSGVPEVDRSALRAILASNPLPPLPRDYSGGSVDVQFYFDFHRQ